MFPVCSSRRVFAPFSCKPAYVRQLCIRVDFYHPPLPTSALICILCVCVIIFHATLLYSIGSEEVKRELPEDAKRFEGIDANVKKELRTCWEMKNVNRSSNQQGMQPTYPRKHACMPE